MSKKALVEVIDETPAGLEHLYDRQWDNIMRFPHLKRSRALDLLRWAAFALRPLTIYEMTEALVINHECDDLPLDELPDTIDQDFVDSGIIGLCGSLLEVRSNSSELSVGLRTVHLAHFSVRQYFVAKMSPPAGTLVTNERLRFSNEAIHSGILGQLCLRYVNFRSVWKPLQVESCEVKRSFRDYAAGSWYQHATEYGRDINAVGLVNTLFDSSNPNWDACRRLFDQNNAELDGEDGTKTASPLYYASRLGLVETVRHLVQIQKHGLKEGDMPGRKALGAACINGNMTIVDILLQAGASIADTDCVGRTPLYLAAWYGHDNLVKLFLERGADLTVPNTNGWTPLNLASNKGHVEVVRLLLEKGADVTVANNNGWTPLNMASNNGHVDVVKL
ncbi:ankyrin repeat-containing domain protein, partial [Diplogelasinospora grovesii]